MLSTLWFIGTSNAKCMSCHKAIVVTTGRGTLFSWLHIYIYIYIYITVWTPFIKGGLSFRNFWKKGNKIGVAVLETGGITIFILINTFQCYLSLSVCCVCVFFIYTISIHIVCVSQEEPGLIASNAMNYYFNEIKIVAVNRCCEYIFVWVCQTTGKWVCCVSCVCVFVCVWYQIRVLAKNTLFVKPQKTWRFVA